MKFWKYIPVLLAVAVIAPGCIDDLDNPIDENPDDAVTITYLGKGFLENKTIYGDLFSIEADEDFMYDYQVVSKGGQRGSTVPQIDELFSGTGTYACGLLPEGNYTFVVMEKTTDGKHTGVRYTKDVEVASYISYEMDGALSPQAGWKAEYIGRYPDQDASGATIYCDRISSSGTGNALYYHVICPSGAIKSSEDLLMAFRKGAGVDDLRGGEGLIDWYKMIAPSFGYLIGLDGLLAKGGKESDSGYMDYTLGSPSTGTFDVYTVEMLLNGHITGRYGKTTLEITGTPNIKAVEVAPSASRALRRMQIKK